MLFTLPSFFLSDPSPPQIYTLSLHDALPISLREPELRTLVGGVEHLHRQDDRASRRPDERDGRGRKAPPAGDWRDQDRKSTRLNSSHLGISYAVFCLKKKKINKLATTA